MAFAEKRRRAAYYGEIYRILFEGKPPQKAIDDLMERQRKPNDRVKPSVILTTPVILASLKHIYIVRLLYSSRGRIGVILTK